MLSLPRVFQATVNHLINWKMRHLLELKVYQGASSFKRESERKKSLDWWAPNLLSCHVEAARRGLGLPVLTPFSWLPPAAPPPILSDHL